MSDARKSTSSHARELSNGRVLTEGYQVRRSSGMTYDGYQTPKAQGKPPAPSSGSGVKPPPSQKKS
jgi:hypothetical protein